MPDKRRRTKSQLRAMFAKLRSVVKGTFAEPYYKPSPKKYTGPSSAKPVGEALKQEPSKDVKAGKVLTEKEERGLMKMLKSKDGHAQKTARKRLVEGNLRLVSSVAKQFKGHSFEDLVQEGNIGLMKAAETYDPHRGTKFSTHATNIIKQHITKAVEEQSDTIKVPAGYHWDRVRLLRLQGKFERQHGRTPTHKELAATTKMSTDRVKTLLEQHPRSVSLDKPTGGENEEGILSSKFTLKDKLQAIKDSPSDSSRASRDRLRVLINTQLSPKEQDIIVSRYGLEGKEQTGAEVGRRLKISRQRVQQLEEQAIKKMKAPPDRKRIKAFIKQYRRS